MGDPGQPGDQAGDMGDPKKYKKYLVANLITPRALFSPTYLLNLVQLEIAPFDQPTRKPYFVTEHGVNRMIRRGDRLSPFEIFSK